MRIRVAAVDLSQNRGLSVGVEDSASDVAFVELLTSPASQWRYLNVEATGFANKPCRTLIEQACNAKFITLRMGQGSTTQGGGDSAPDSAACF